MLTQPTHRSRADSHPPLSLALALLDDVYRAAFRGSPLGRGLLFPASRVGNVTAAMVADFRAHFVTGPNTVVSGVGTYAGCGVWSTVVSCLGLQTSTMLRWWRQSTS